MSWPQLLSRLVIGLFIATGGVGRVMAGHGDQSVPPEPPPEAPQPSAEQGESSVENKSAEHGKETASPTSEAKKDDHQETAQRDELLILLLQILRSSK